MTNLGFRLAMGRRRDPCVETPVGDRYVLEALDAGGFTMGGEQSGHVIFRDRPSTGDGLLTGVLLARRSHALQRRLADLAAAMHGCLRCSSTSPLSSESPTGRRPGRDRGRLGRGPPRRHRSGAVAPSGTEPLLRVMVEAADPTLPTRPPNTSRPSGARWGTDRPAAQPRLSWESPHGACTLQRRCSSACGGVSLPPSPSRRRLRPRPARPPRRRRRSPDRRLPRSAPRSWATTVWATDDGDGRPGHDDASGSADDVGERAPTSTTSLPTTTGAAATFDAFNVPPRLLRLGLASDPFATSVLAEDNTAVDSLAFAPVPRGDRRRIDLRPHQRSGAAELHGGRAGSCLSAWSQRRCLRNLFSDFTGAAAPP